MLKTLLLCGVTLAACLAFPDGTSTWADNLDTPRNVGMVTKLEVGEDEFSVRSFSASTSMPLIVDLHQWSLGTGESFGNDYRLDLAVMARGWNYIRPAMGRNNTPAGCCNPLSLARLGAAIEYAKSQGNVDDSAVYVVGASGGGYVALCALMQDTPGIAGYEIWAAISDLAAWHDQTRGTRYAADVRACTGSKDVLDIAEAQRRSPLHMPTPQSIPRTHIYAGVRDGWQGTVPITQSIRMFNRLATDTGHDAARIDDEMMLQLLEGRGAEGFIDSADDATRYRHLVRDAGNVELVLYEGVHEGLSAQVLKDIEAMLVAGPAT